MPKSFTDTEKLDALRLIRSENVGPVTYHQLTSFFNSPSAALEALPSLAERGGRRKPIKIYSKRAAEKEIAALLKLDGQLVLHGEHTYPLALSVINDAPPVLSVLGHIHLLKRPMVAIVGARNASAAGLRMTERLAAGLGERDFLIVSGMARGIDAKAHEYALPYGTAAILAGGIDNIYPAENEELYFKIKAEGVLMAENPLGVKPLARHFPRRNRIIAGLSLGVIVTEAALRSGSLITARLAGEQGREVMAIPGSPLDPRCRGGNYLIKNGAALVENVDDALDVLRELTDKNVKEPITDSHYKEMQTQEPDASERQAIIDLLGLTPISVDEIIERSRLPISLVHMVLVELDLAGRLNRGAQGVNLIMDGTEAEPVA